MLQYDEHIAGGGSRYITIGDIKICIADHENTSLKYDDPDFNIVNRNLNQDDVNAIAEKLDYPAVCKQRVFALHTDLTIPKLKKILPETCFEKILENEYYYNTFTTVIKTAESLQVLAKNGYHKRIPIRQERYSYEDFNGLY